MIGTLVTLLSYAWGEPLEVPVFPVSTGISQGDYAKAEVAQEALASGDTSVASRPAAPFPEWNRKTDQETYFFTQALLRIQPEKECMVYGKITEKEPFQWHIVPYEKKTGLARYFQQLKVLFRVIFGERAVPLEEQITLQEDYAARLKKLALKPESLPTRIDAIRDESCPFCHSKNIERQQVFEGDLVRILHDHAPVTDGHVLIIPKRHVGRFHDLTEKEYCALTKRVREVVRFLFQEKLATAVYVRQSNGPSAGRSVHGHLHFNVMPVNTSTEEWAGRFEVLKRMTLGSTRLNVAALQTKVAEFTKRFASICQVEESSVSRECAPSTPLETSALAPQDR